MSCYPLQVVSRMVMNRSGEVFYIGGNDVLPAPLEPKREAFILQKLGTGQEEEAKSVLIEHNLRLVVYIAKKFDNTGVGSRVGFSDDVFAFEQQGNGFRLNFGHFGKILGGNRL